MLVVTAAQTHPELDSLWVSAEGDPGKLPASSRSSPVLECRHRVLPLPFSSTGTDYSSGNIPIQEQCG